MFKTFCEKLEYDYKPSRGNQSNIIQYFELCELIRAELTSHNNLLKLHSERIGKDEFLDREFTILTQDFIYAVARHLSIDRHGLAPLNSRLILKKTSLQPTLKAYTFKGKFIDYVSKYKRDKHIGDLGELWVLRHEKEHCSPKYADEITAIAKSYGDGLGYDILSFDDDGHHKYIEVKTTKGDAKTSFFISRVELERSRQEGHHYYLYRLYNFDETKMKANLFILQGDLSKYCINPSEYEVMWE
jgi:hypothetical protein